jgi:AcrR family transcriptional regulator
MTARAEAAAATGERVLASAWRHFGRLPYEAVRLADIAADAQVTVQTLHDRFGTKDELFVAAFQWFGTNEGARRDTVPVGNVRIAVQALFDSYERDGPSVLRLMTQEDRIPAVRTMINAGRAYHRSWVARVFARELDGRGPAARERQLVELTVATDLLVWNLLRQDMTLSRRAAESIVVEMITKLKGAG